MLKPSQEHIDEIVHSIIEFMSEKKPEETIKEDYVRKLLGQTGTIVALNVMNDIAYNASNNNTIIALRDGGLDNSNHKIMRLMMEENTGDTSEFVSSAISIRKELNGSPYAKILIAQIAKKHIIYTKNIDHRQVNRLISSGVVSSDSKTVLLLEKEKNSKN